MISRRSLQFREAFDQLPCEIKDLAKRVYEQWHEDPFLPSLQFKNLHGAIYSVRIGDHYRALGRKVDRADGDIEDTIVWHWIGTHERYNSLIRRL